MRDVWGDPVPNVSVRIPSVSDDSGTQGTVDGSKWSPAPAIATPATFAKASGSSGKVVVRAEYFVEDAGKISRWRSTPPAAAHFYLSHCRTDHLPLVSGERVAELQVAEWKSGIYFATLHACAACTCLPPSLHCADGLILRWRIEADEKVDWQLAQGAWWDCTQGFRMHQDKSRRQPRCTCRTSNQRFDFANPDSLFC